MGDLQSQDITTIQAPPIVALPQPESLNNTVAKTPASVYNTFPYQNSLGRLSDYEYFNNLFMGQAWEAFSIRINSKEYTKDYAKLRYTAVNFAGLLSKLIADMLFSEPISIKASETGDQDWIDAFVQENNLNELLYESALSNSSLGDGLLKLRIGKRHPNDDHPSIILENVTPTIYFPRLDGFNVSATPTAKELAWTFELNSIQYLRQEIHTPGEIDNHVYQMSGNNIEKEEDLKILGIPGLTGIGMKQETGVDRYLVIHIPNWKTVNRHFGISDYYDLDKLFFAINNRLSKVDNILDKHSDPILMIPDGVLDENGNVNREKLHMVEVPEGNGAKVKPEYIVWNANLEAAFTQIDKLIDFLMMTAEITPDVLGMGQGMNDSGRALKFKLMRTIAKAQRKKLYYDRAIKEAIYVAQLLAQKWQGQNVTVGPDKLKFSGTPEIPDIEWQDGLPIDDYEEVTNEIAKIDAGLQSKLQAIQNLDGVDEEAAKEKLEEIEEEQPTLEVPSMMPPGYTQPASTGDTTDPNNTNPNTTKPDGAAPQLKTPVKPANDNANPKKPQKGK